MAKQTPPPAAASIAEEAPKKKTTDKAYATLPLHTEIVVQVGPRQRMQANKLVTVEEARNVIFTKAGYEAMDRDEAGETIHVLTEVLGIPDYKTVEDPTSPDGKRKDFDILYFAEGAGWAVADEELENA